jgi:hypothetical protein
MLTKYTTISASFYIMPITWGAVNARISLFPAISQPIPSALDLYKSIFRNDPESWQKGTNPLAASVAQGRTGDIGANCVVQATRIDFNLFPIAGAEPGRLYLIDDTPKLYELLRSIIRQIGEGTAQALVTRVATFLQLSCPTQTVIEANALLLATIPWKYRVELVDEEDFVFQINRPRPGRDNPDLRMNFITKWSTDRFTLFSMHLPISGVPQFLLGGGSPTGTPSELFAASITFDNNNVPIANPLSFGQQATLLGDALNAAEAESA